MRMIYKVIIPICIFVGIIIITIYPAMWLWNWLMPKVFNLPRVSLSEILGLEVLSTILFKPISLSGTRGDD